MTYIDWSTIDAILELEPENHKVIDFLIICIQNCIESEQYDFQNKQEAIKRLKNIGKTNHYNLGKYTISKLVGLIDNHRQPYNSIACNAIEILPEVPPRSSEAIALEGIPKGIILLETWLQQETNRILNNNGYLHSIKLLGEISPKNKIAIKHLEILVENCQDEDDKIYLIEEILIKIEPSNILIFEYYLNNFETKGIYNEDNPEGLYGGELFQWLEKIEPNNFPIENIMTIIEILIQWMDSLQPEDYLWIEDFCQWLGKVDYSNILEVRNKVINCLINRLKIQQEPQWGGAQHPILKCLGEIASGKIQAIEYLASWIENPDNSYCEEAITVLGNITNVDNINLKDNAINAIITYVKADDFWFEEKVEIICQALTKIDTERRQVVNIFICWIENKFENDQDLQKVVIKWLGIVANQNEKAINCILSWMNNNNDCFGEYLCERSVPIEALARIDSKNELVVNEIASFINNIDSINAESWLNHYDDNEEGQNKLDVAINALIKIGRGNQTIINALANLISNIESNYENVYKINIDIFRKIDINQQKIIDLLYNKGLNNPHSDIDLKETAVDYLFLLYQENLAQITNFSSVTEPEQSLSENIDQLNIIDKLTNLLNIKESKFLENIFNHAYGHEIIEKILQGFHKNSIYKPITIDIICSLMNDQKIYQDHISSCNLDKTIFDYLGNNQLAKTKSIEALNSIIRNAETDDYTYQDAIEWLIKTWPAEEKVIDLLFYLTQPHGEDDENLIKEKEELRELWMNNAKEDKNINNTVKILEKFLVRFNNDFKTIEATLLLFKLAPNNDRALEGIIFLIQQDNITQKKINQIIEILGEFHRKGIIKEQISLEKIQKIVTVVSQIFNNFSLKNYENINTYSYYNNIYKQILWYCTQNLAYPDFYRAWTLPSN